MAPINALFGQGKPTFVSWVRRCRGRRPMKTYVEALKTKSDGS